MWILYIFGLIILLGMASYISYKVVTQEKYKKLKQIGTFPLLSNQIMKTNSGNNNINHKYDSHRYKHRRRYNHLGQQRRYD